MTLEAPKVTAYKPTNYHRQMLKNNPTESVEQVLQQTQELLEKNRTLAIYSSTFDVYSSVGSGKQDLTPLVKKAVGLSEQHPNLFKMVDAELASVYGKTIAKKVKKAFKMNGGKKIEEAYNALYTKKGRAKRQLIIDEMSYSLERKQLEKSLKNVENELKNQDLNTLNRMGIELYQMDLESSLGSLNTNRFFSKIKNYLKMI